jgi:MarR family transcriptional regulator, organic hydroperoxide resistance regulator
MKRIARVKAAGRRRPRRTPPQPFNLPLEKSVGYQVRMTHRALQRYLQVKIEPHGVTLGMWYFLRILWREDGLTQRELSHRVGTREPTTLIAIVAMQRRGLVARVRDRTDRRKQIVSLTAAGRRLQAELLPVAAEVVNTAVAGFSQRDTALLLKFLSAIQRNLARASSEGPGGPVDEAFL